MQSNLYGSIKKQKHFQNEREELILKNLPLAFKVSHNYTNMNSGFFDKEDLEQIAILGLIESVDRFDPEVGQLSTYSHYYCNGRILRFIRDNNSVKFPRSVLEANSKANKYADEGLSEQEIAEKIGPDYEKVRAFKELRNVGSLDIMTDHDSDYTFHEVVPNKYNLEQEVSLSMDLQNALNQLSYEERVAVELTYFEDKTQREIAEVLNTNQVNISRVLKKALNKMKIKLGSSYD